MTYWNAIAVLCSFWLATPCLAQGVDAKPWFEMADACEAVVTDQTLDAFDVYPRVDPVFDLPPGLELAIRHPNAALQAHMMSDGSIWFLCLVVADPPPTGFEQAGLIGQITGRFFAQGFESDDITIVLNGNNILAPVRVSCHDNGLFTAVFAQLTDNGLQITALNTFPDSDYDPCSEHRF